MALASGTVWEIRASATTGNTGGAGFNTANANFPTDLTATSATGNSPVVSSATYTFVSPGDVGAWVYIKAGTNWTPGWYQIASVSGGAATLSAAIGQAVQIVNNLYTPNTVAGVATTASPTGGTYGVDYSQQNSAQTTATDFASTGASSTLTSATAAFTPVMVGNIFHQTTTGTGAHGTTGWYEIVSYTNATTVVLDRTPNDGTASVATTGFVGGAGRLNGLEDAFYEMIPDSSIIWVKSGSYTFSASVSIASGSSTFLLTSFTIGYTSMRGDTCTGSNRPTFFCGANNLTWGQSQSFTNISATMTSATGWTTGNGAALLNCKIFNSSTTAGRPGWVPANTRAFAVDSEFVSLNGSAISGGQNTLSVLNCYMHDSVSGFVSSAGIGVACAGNIIEACSTDAINFGLQSGGHAILNNTIYGREAKMGTGINLSISGASNSRVINNILYGLTTGISITTAGSTSNLSYYNDYFNNTTDASNWIKGSSAKAINPGFLGATQITGTTATTSSTVLTQSGGDFSTVTDNVDCVRVLSGTGVTVGNYLITSHTTTTLTVTNALGTSSAGDVNYFVTTGHNFAIGPNLKGQGFPGAFNGSETTGYMATGAVQRQDPTLSSTFVS